MTNAPTQAGPKHTCKYCKDTVTLDPRDASIEEVFAEWEREHKQCRRDYCSHGVYMGSRVKENGSINCGMCE